MPMKVNCDSSITSKPVHNRRDFETCFHDVPIPQTQAQICRMPWETTGTVESWVLRIPSQKETCSFFNLTLIFQDPGKAGLWPSFHLEPKSKSRRTRVLRVPREDQGWDCSVLPPRPEAHQAPCAWGSLHPPRSAGKTQRGRPGPRAGAMHKWKTCGERSKNLAGR